MHYLPAAAPRASTAGLAAAANVSLSAGTGFGISWNKHRHITNEGHINTDLLSHCSEQSRPTEQWGGCGTRNEEPSSPPAMASAFYWSGRNGKLIRYILPLLLHHYLNYCLFAFQMSYFPYLWLHFKGSACSGSVDLRAQEEFLASSQTGWAMLTAFFPLFFASKEGTVKSRTRRLIPAICRNV